MLGRFIAVIGGIFGFYVAGYTGVLLAVTNRPIWSDTPLLGMLFIVSAASISAALMILLAQKSRWTMPGLRDLHRMDVWVIALEFIVLIALMISLGPVFRAWLSAWGLLLLDRRRHRRHAAASGAFLASAVARGLEHENDRCSYPSRRFPSPPGDRLLGRRSMR